MSSILQVAIGWPARAVRVVSRDSADVVRVLLARRSALAAVTRIELRKRYAGSAFGLLWIPFQAILILGLYCYLYRSADDVAGFKGFDKVLFFICGLVPYLAFSDSVAVGAPCVKQNIAIVKNVLIPMELVPTKTVLAALVGHSGTLGILLVLLAARGLVSPHWLYLPVPLALQLLFTLGTVWLLAPLVVVVPDVSHVINLFLLVLLFAAPIGQEIAGQSPFAQAVMLANPLTYLIDEYRFALVGHRMLPWWVAPISLSVAAIYFAIGATFFRKMARVFADYE